MLQCRNLLADKIIPARDPKQCVVQDSKGKGGKDLKASVAAS